MADEGAGIDIDGGHRFGLIDDQVTAGFQLHLALQRTLDLVFHVVKIENRLAAGVQLQLAGDVRNVFAGELHQQIVGQPRIDADAIQRRAGEVAQDALRQRQLAIQLIFGLVAFFTLHHLGPQALEEGGVLRQLFFADAFRRGADDEPAQFVAVSGDGVLQALALGFAFNALRYPDVRRARHKHQVTRRQGDVGGQARALGAERILHHLHHQVLPLAHQFGDVAHVEVLLLIAGHAFGMRHDVGGMQEGGLVQADIDERRLHARQDAADAPLVYIADDAAFGFAFDMDLLQDAAVDIGNPRFRRCDINQ
ncbi:Uncharacterised protein [Serratia ficaria]|nr:Uncharacterised protein [Serratia ficaria]